jgi:hypothetical protein
MYAVVDVLQPGDPFKGDTRENLFPFRNPDVVSETGKHG